MNFTEYNGSDYYNENEYLRMFKPIGDLTIFSDSNTTKNFIDVHNVYWKYMYDCYMNQPELKLEKYKCDKELEKYKCDKELEKYKCDKELEKYKCDKELEKYKCDKELELELEKYKFDRELEIKYKLKQNMIN
jgi:hypothetical protein